MRLGYESSCIAIKTTFLTPQNEFACVRANHGPQQVRLRAQVRNCRPLPSELLASGENRRQELSQICQRSQFHQAQRRQRPWPDDQSGGKSDAIVNRCRHRVWSERRIFVRFQEIN